MDRTRAWWVVVAALLGAVNPSRAEAVPPSVLPGLGQGAVRQAVDVGRRPWRGVVRVQTEVGRRCTGALVGPRTVLTAAHCLFGRDTGRVVRPASIHVLTGYDHGAYDGQARAVAVAVGPGFGLGLDGRRLPSSPPDADWAVLTLDSPLGTPDRVLPLAHEPAAPGTPAMLAGYEQDRAEILEADTTCRIVGTVAAGTARLLQHSCAGTRGVSGAPLLVRDPDGGWAVAGIVSASWIGAPGGYAVPIGAMTIPAQRQ